LRLGTVCNSNYIISTRDSAFCTPI